MQYHLGEEIYILKLLSFILDFKKEKNVLISNLIEMDSKAWCVWYHKIRGVSPA